MGFKFFKNQMSLPLRSIAIGTFLAFAGALFINSSSDECRVVSMYDSINNESVTLKSYACEGKLLNVSEVEYENSEKSKVQSISKLFLEWRPFLFCVVVLLAAACFSFCLLRVKIENESKNDSSFEKDENSTKLENNSYSEINEEEEEKKEKQEVNVEVINGGSSSRIAGIAAASTAVGVGAASGAAVSGINELVNSNNLVNAKVRVGETVDANKVTDGEGAPERQKDFGDDETNETKNSENLNEK